MTAQRRLVPTRLVPARSAPLLAALAAAGLVAACSSTTSGSLVPGGVGGSRPAGSSAGTGSTGATSSATGSAGSAAGGPIGSAAQLGATMRQALSSVTSDHVSFVTTVRGEKLVGEGDQQLSAGRSVAFRITEQVPGVGEIDLVSVAGKTYLKAPASIGGGSSDKPWVLVTATSSNPIARTIAPTLAQASAAGSLDQLTAFAAAATGFRPVGAGTVGGAAVSRYSITVSVAKLPTTFPGIAALQKTGISDFTAVISIDGSGRPVQLQQSIAFAGIATTTTVTLSDFDKPVTITAPPASQVDTN